MLTYIKENYGNRPSANEGEMQELIFLRKQTAALKAELNMKPKQIQSTASDKDDSSDGSESEGEYVDELPETAKIAKASGARMSVSAEVFGKFNLQQEYKPPVYEKTQE